MRIRDRYYTQKHPEARNANTISIEMCCKCDGDSSSAEDKRWYFTKETQEAVSYTHSNLWFQNGKTKGFLLDSNGDLYVSFSYARGGTLKLGGVNNGNGLLSILDADGSQVGYIDNTGVHFNQGEFSGKVTAETGKIGGFTIDKTNLHTGNRTTINSVGAGAYLGNNGFSCSDGKNKLANLNTGYLWIRTTAARSSANGIYMERYGASSRGYISAELIALEDTADELITEDYFRVNKSGLSVRGSKNRIAKTNNYQDRLLYCYEMGSPFFGDIGMATIGADGKCFVDIDDIFSETVIPGMEYYVFLQKEGEGDLCVSQKTETYFEVSGTPGLRFSWELKARQSGYGYEPVSYTHLSYRRKLAQTNSVTDKAEKSTGKYGRSLKTIEKGAGGAQRGIGAVSYTHLDVYKRQGM